MASRNQRPGPVTDNRAQTANFGTPQAQSLDLASVLNGDNVVEGRSPEFTTAAITLPEPDAAPVLPIPEGQPAQPPAPPEPAPPPAPEPPPAPAKDEDKFTAMSVDDLRKLAKHQEQMIGRQSEEVGTYRKLFDRLHTPSPTAQPPAQPDPAAKFLKSKLSEDEKQELIALSLTDPEKHEEIQFARFQARQEAMQRQRQMIEEAERVRDIVTTPEFAKFEKTLPPSLIQSAMHDPRVLRWVISQFQGTPAPASAPAPLPPAPPTPQPQAPVDRVVRLGNAGGAPSAGAPASSTPTFTRLQLAKMMTEAPEEYAARQPEILQAYREGRVR